MGGGAAITFVVSYRCPHCGAALEGRTARADAWLRCPGCSRASQPPDHAVTPEATRPPAAAPAEDLLVIGPEPEPAPMTPVAFALPAPIPVRPAEAASPARVALAAALFVAVVFLVFSFLDQSLTGTAVFSIAAFVFLVLLARPDGSRERPR